MSLLTANKEKATYIGGTLRLVAAIAVAVAAKIGDLLIQKYYPGRYVAASKAAFCVVAAICAYVAYTGVMELGCAYDRRHKDAAKNVGCRKATVGEVVSFMTGRLGDEVAILSGDTVYMAGSRAKSAATEEFEAVFYVGEDEYESEEELAKRLSSLVGEDGRLTLGAINGKAADSVPFGEEKADDGAVPEENE